MRILIHHSLAGKWFLASRVTDPGYSRRSSMEAAEVQ